MAYCWEVYQNSKCDTCKHYLAYQNGSLNIDEVKDVVIVEDED